MQTRGDGENGRERSSGRTRDDEQRTLGLPGGREWRSTLYKVVVYGGEAAPVWACIGEEAIGVAMGLTGINLVGLRGENLAW